MWLIPISAPGIFRKDRSSLDLTRKLISVVGDPYSPFFRIRGAMPTLILVNTAAAALGWLSKSSLQFLNLLRFSQVHDRRDHLSLPHSR